MLKLPKRTNYKKTKKGRLSKFEFKANKLKFGTIGLKALESGMVSFNQLESSRQAIVKKINRKGKVWIKVFPNYPITKKSTGSRMGKGKGAVALWASKIKSGTIIFEVCGITEQVARSALKAGGTKLSIKTRIFI